METVYSAFLKTGQISTDTRNIQEGSLFFALKGESFDGNLYAAEALERGASFAVVDNPEVVSGDSYILVHDVLVSLQELARTYRDTFRVPVLALTGSNGKTTTKELTRDVLARKFKVHATRGNLNNHIGVPLTLLSAPADTEFFIIEMGANHQGEIDALCHIASPTHCMITNIGKAHLEGFGGVEGIKRGKSEMYRFVSGNSGKIFLNTDDAVLSSLVPVSADRINYSPTSLLTVEKTDPTLAFRYADRVVTTHLYGEYNISNISFAIASGEYFGVEKQDIALAIEQYIPDNNRSQLQRRGTNTFILDAYNANPTSMRASLESLAKIPGHRKVAILGDMLELGDYAMEEHMAIIDLTESLAIDDVLFIGPCFTTAGAGRKGHYFTDVLAASPFFNALQLQHSIVLLKGSRGIAVEKILPSLTS